MPILGPHGSNGKVCKLTIGVTPAYPLCLLVCDCHGNTPEADSTGGIGIHVKKVGYLVECTLICGEWS